MAISLAPLQTSTSLRPPRVLIHGVAGIGKSTFAASANAPVFVLTEDGLGKLQVPHFPLATSYAEVAEALDALLDEDHAYSTVVVDSVDWLEPLIWAEACRRNGWQSMESPGFGKGYAEALNIWREYIDKLNGLRNRKGMAVIQIAHTDIKRFVSPEHEPYDRYVIKLQARASALLQEHSDVVLFANYRISVSKSDVGFNKKVTRALGSGARVMHTEERPAFLAKNRYGPAGNPPARVVGVPGRHAPIRLITTERTARWHVSTPPLTPPASSPPPPTRSCLWASIAPRSSRARCASRRPGWGSISG
jgi:hypothetical protein